MGQLQITNFADSTLAAGIAAGDTAFSFSAGDATTTIPTIIGTDWSWAVLVDTSGNKEIIKITAHAAGTRALTVTRAQEGTAARAFTVGSLISCRLTKQGFLDFITAAGVTPVATQIVGATVKNAPVDNDTFGYINSENAWALVKTTWSQLKTAFLAAFVATTNVWTKGQSGAVVALTDSATVAVDLSLSNNFSLLTTAGIGATRKLGNPTNIAVGQSGVITVTTDAVSRLLTFDTYYKFAGGATPTLSAASGAVDVFSYYVIDATHIMVSQAKGVA